MILTLEIPGLDKFLQELGNDGVVESGVSVEGEAAAYAEVWEWGTCDNQNRGLRLFWERTHAGKECGSAARRPLGIFGRMKASSGIALVKN